MKSFISLALPLCAICANAQTYPDVEFTNEIYYLKKDSGHSLVRLEKDVTKLESKSKAAGFGGFESAYNIDGERSSTRIQKAAAASFVFSTGQSSPGGSTAMRDSMLRANGLDPADLSGIGSITDPANTISLYKTDVAKGQRKIVVQKGGGLGAKKIQSSEKYTFSTRKIRGGYWELVIDKSLPRGEYAFSVMAVTAGNMDGSITVYCFGID